MEVTVEYKCEPDLNNPWAVKQLEDFLFYCCLECSDRSQTKETFIHHALIEHPMSRDSIPEVELTSDIKIEPVLANPIPVETFKGEEDISDSTWQMPPAGKRSKQTLEPKVKWVKPEDTSLLSIPIAADIVEMLMTEKDPLDTSEENYSSVMFQTRRVTILAIKTENMTLYLPQNLNEISIKTEQTFDEYFKNEEMDDKFDRLRGLLSTKKRKIVDKENSDDTTQKKKELE
jgi:hypothetical protein